MGSANLAVSIIAAAIAGAALFVAIVYNRRYDTRAEVQQLRDEARNLREEQQAMRDEARAFREENAFPHAAHLSDDPAGEGYHRYRYEVTNSGGATALDLHLELITEDDQVEAETFVTHLRPGERAETEIVIPTPAPRPLRVRFYWYDESYTTKHKRHSRAKVPSP